MLRKLIKYDMKALNHFLILIHGFLLFASILIRVLCTGRISINDDNSIILFLGYAVFILLMVAVVFSTFFVIAMRFYKHLFSDEGYLAFTLPVSKGSHLLSKTIAGTIWGFIDTVIALIATWIVMFTPDTVKEIVAEIPDFISASGLRVLPSLPIIAVCFLLFLLLSCLTSIVCIYASICIGQFFSGHRALGSVVIYFAINTVTSLIGAFILAINGLLSARIDNNTVSANLDISTYLSNATLISVIVSVVITIILYIISYIILKKKVNLS